MSEYEKLADVPCNDLLLKQQLGDLLDVITVLDQEILRTLVGHAGQNQSTQKFRSISHRNPYVIILRTSKSNISPVFSLKGFCHCSDWACPPP